MFIHLRDIEATQAWIDSIDTKITGFKPHSIYQAEPILDYAPLIILQCSRRTGKTVCVIYLAVQRAIELARTPALLPGVERGKDSYTAEEMYELKPGVHIQIVAPTRSLASSCINTLEQIIPDAWKVRNRHGHKIQSDEVQGTVGIDRRMTMRVDMRLTDDPNAPADPTLVRPDWTIEVISSMSTGSAQGSGPDVTIFTEAHELDEDTWNRAQGMSWDPHRLGQQVIESVPSPNPQHWTARIWRSAVRDTTGESNAYRWTVCENPLNKPRTLRMINASRGVKLDEARWWREAMAHRPSGSGGYFTFLDKVLVPDLDVDESDGRYSYVAGFDHGASRNTVLIIKRKEDGRTVFGTSFEPSMTDNYVLQRACGLILDWNVSAVRVDMTGPSGVRWTQDMRDQLPNVDVRGESMNGPEKSKLYEEYNIGIENRWSLIPASLTTLYEQMSAIKQRHGNAGFTMFESEGGLRDDWVDAEVLAYAALEIDARERRFSFNPDKEDAEALDMPAWWEGDGWQDDEPDIPHTPAYTVRDMELMLAGKRMSDHLMEALDGAY